MDRENVDGNREFLSGMSHEVRTALNIMMASCTMAQNHIDDRERVMRYLKQIYITVDRLTRLVDSILDNYRCRHDLGALREEPFHIDDLRRELLELLEPLASEKSLELIISSEDFSNKEVIGDYGRLLQILVNLATNSIKYTPAEGAVQICFEELESDDPALLNCRFICRDNGIGIQEDFIEHIFEPFARANDENVRQAKGSGLGMYIVKEAVDLMGGNIHLDSMVGAGTTVTIQLKLRKNMRKG